MGRKITQAGHTLSSATAAERITRATAEKALQQFLSRVEQVNNDPYSLGKVTRVVLFGSMLKPEVERLSDVDLALFLLSIRIESESRRIPLHRTMTSAEFKSRRSCDARNQND